jgi:RNA polymerase sigma-70 factor, ECF subfamily
MSLDTLCRDGSLTVATRLGSRVVAGGPTPWAADDSPVFGTLPLSMLLLTAHEFDQELAAIVPTAYGVALRLTRNRADAEDLVQEAALHACRGRAGFEPGTNFRAWFFRILTTTFWGAHRRAGRRPSTIDFDDAPALQLYQRSLEAGLPRDGENPTAALIDRMGTERVAEALGALPEEFGVVCTLYFMEDFAYHEIADILGVPVGTVRSRLHRGRKMLQKALWEVATDAGIVAVDTGEMTC